MRKSSKAILFALLLVGVLGAAFFTAKGDEASGATPVAQADQPRGAAPAANGDQSAGSTPGEDADQSTGSEADKYWSTECTGSSRALDKLVCSATQSILLAQSKELLFRIKVVVAAGSSAPVMEIQGPLNVYLPAGFSLSVDGAPLTKVSVSNCNRRGCFGGLQLSDAMLASLKRGGSLKIGFSLGPDQAKTAETPLDGFTRAMQSIQ